MTSVSQSLQVECNLLTDGDLPSELRPIPTSCGLDFWQSAAALVWLGRFLDARSALITVQAGSRKAALSCLLRRLPFGVVLASAYPYAALMGDAELFWQSGAVIAPVLRKHGVVRLEMPFTGEYAPQLPPHDGESGRFREARPLDAVRHVLDLASAAGDVGWLLGQLAPNTRWAIRKAERTGSHIRLATSGDVDTLQAIYAATMRAKGAPVNYGPERFRGMLEELFISGVARVYLGEVDGRPAGMAAVLDAGISRHLLQLAVLPAAQTARLGDLLVATTIREGIAKGQRYFDFMASSPRDAGLVAYKAKWATRPEAIRYMVLTVNPLMSFALDAGRWMNAQRGRVVAYAHRPSAEEPQPGPS